jgi:hypothetical protein
MKRVFLFALLVLSACSDQLDFVNRRAPDYYRARGFKIVSYQGYNFTPPGRCYWYVTEREGKLWESCLLRWGDGIHEYSLRSLEALPAPR